MVYNPWSPCVPLFRKIGALNPRKSSTTNSFTKKFSLTTNSGELVNSSRRDGLFLIGGLFGLTYSHHQPYCFRNSFHLNRLATRDTNPIEVKITEASKIPAAEDCEVLITLSTAIVKLESFVSLVRVGRFVMRDTLLEAIEEDSAKPTRPAAIRASPIVRNQVVSAISNVSFFNFDTEETYEPKVYNNH